MRNKKEINFLDIMYSPNNMNNNDFRKQGLELLKSKYKKTTQDFIKDTYPKNYFKKSYVKWNDKII